MSINIKEKFQKKTVLVIGDLMMDRYCFGQVKRISPEAPVPVFLKDKEDDVPGGAANVAMNLLFAGQEVILMSVLGDDEYGWKLHKLLRKEGCECRGIVHSKTRCTSIKTRLMAQNNQQMIRIDEETVSEINTEEEKILLKNLMNESNKIDAIVLSDYLKGVLTKSLCRKVINIAKEYKIPVFVDIKDVNTEKYNGATVLKPNQSELFATTGMPVSSNEEILNAANVLREKCGSEYVLVTLGSKGMVLVGDSLVQWIPSFEHEVYDVSGAGDTVISYLVAGYVNDMDMVNAALIANCAAGIKVTKLGTAPVGLDELSKVWNKDNNIYGITKKVLTIEEMKVVLKNKGNKKVVFTNGCFDILHLGHVGYLRKAASLGDILIIGLNSDDSVKRLKGESRPLNCEFDRAEILSALEFVDYVVVFDDDTPIKLIETIVPDILVKGADYKKEDVVGASIVEMNGGRVELIPFLENHSTTTLVQKMNGN